MDFIWESMVLITAGLILLRFAGRKSISQLTVPTTVVMISIGSLIIQPIVEKSVLKTIVATAVIIAVLIIAEYLEMKFDFIEKLLTGNSLTVIENGQIVEKNLRKMRFTVDKLEVRLRQLGIKKISDVKTATLEPNGQLGYELQYDAQPLTIGEFKKMMNFLSPQIQNASPNFEYNIFDEVKNKTHSTAIKDEFQ